MAIRVTPSFRDGPKDQTQDFPILEAQFPGSMLRIAPNDDVDCRPPSHTFPGKMFAEVLPQFNLAQLAGRGHHGISSRIRTSFGTLKTAERLAAVFGDSSFVGLSTGLPA